MHADLMAIGSLGGAEVATLHGVAEADTWTVQPAEIAALVSDPLFVDIFDGTPSERNPIIVERALLCLPTRDADFMVAYARGLDVETAAQSAHISLHYRRDQTVQATFRELCVDFKNDAFDPIKWKEEHSRLPSAYNVLYFLTMANKLDGEHCMPVSPDEPRTELCARACDWLDQQSADPDLIEAVATVFGLNGGRPQSINVVAREYGLGAESLDFSRYPTCRL